jgi:hypothetical protein
MTFVRNNSVRTFSAVLLLVLGATVFVACGSEPIPAAGRPDFPQPTFVSVEVTPAPVSPTATPWPDIADDDIRVLPKGLDPEFYSEADSGEVIALWEQFLSGSTFAVTSGRFYFRNRTPFEGDLHLCPGGTGYLAGSPEGAIKWAINTSAGNWYEVTITHEIPFTGRDVTFAVGVNDGKPARSGSTTPLEFRASDRCALAPAGIQYAFTAEERKLSERAEIASVDVDEIPWVDGARAFPSQLSVAGSEELSHEGGLDYWRAYLSGGVVEAFAFNYSAFAITAAFVGSLHLCDERVAVLDGEPSGIGEWAVQSTGSNPYDVKIVFTLPGSPSFRTIVLSVDDDTPIRMGRSADTGLISPSPLEIQKSSECG